MCWCRDNFINFRIIFIQSIQKEKIAADSKKIDDAAQADGVANGRAEEEAAAAYTQLSSKQTDMYMMAKNKIDNTATRSRHYVGSAN